MPRRKAIHMKKLRASRLTVVFYFFNPKYIIINSKNINQHIYNIELCNHWHSKPNKHNLLGCSKSGKIQDW